MRNKLLMGAAALAFLSALGHFGAKPLLAQIRAALVKNIDEPGRSPYQSIAGSNNGAQGSCAMTFTAVPPNKRLVAENLSVNIATSSSFVFGSLGAFAPGSPLLFFGATSISANQGVSNQTMKAYFESGAVPTLEFLVNNASSCGIAGTLSGYLVDLTQ